jgi:hypothetical protein
MRKTDAPPPGWYPDPTRPGQLRWWDGLDWSEHRRPPPPSHVARVPEPRRAEDDDDRGDRRASRQARSSGSGRAVSRDETAEIMAEVRRAARDEVERAMGSLSDRARDATRRLEPLIGQYGDRAMKWLRNLAIIIVVLIVLWMVLQVGTQATLLDWIGDRVDNLLGGAVSAPTRIG